MSGATSDVDFTAGFKLLSRFQNQWELIHGASGSSIAKARKVSAKLAHLEHSSRVQQQAYSNLISSYRSLAELDGQIRSINAHLGALTSSFVQIEELLVVLKNFKENSDTSRFVEGVHRDLETRMKEAEKESQARRERLKLDHISRVQEFERRQESQLEERRRLLEQAFEEEKKIYLEQNNKN